MTPEEWDAVLAEGERQANLLAERDLSIVEFHAMQQAVARIIRTLLSAALRERESAKDAAIGRAALTWHRAVLETDDEGKQDDLWDEFAELANAAIAAEREGKS